MSIKNNLPWSMKYTPCNVTDVCVSPEIVQDVLNFIKNFNPKSTKKGLVLYGLTGTGKTTLVYAIANTIDSEVLEINASDSRNKSSMRDILGPAIKQGSLFGRQKIILVDEIEGMSGTKDRGGATELASLIKESSFPIVMTAQNPYDSKFSKLRSVSKLVEVKGVSYERILTILQKISSTENLSPKNNVLESISRSSNGDLRGAINDLQSHIVDDNFVEYDDNENYRDTTSTIPDVLRIIFKSRDLEILNSALNNFEGNFDDVFMWLEYNLPKEYLDFEALSEAYEYLSKYDIYNNRIRKRQYWRYLAYMSDFISSGIGLAKKSSNPKFIKYEQNTRPLKIWMSKRKYARRESISRKIASKIHWSTSEVIKNFEFYKQIAKNKETLKLLENELKLEKDEIAFLKS